MIKKGEGMRMFLLKAKSRWPLLLFVMGTLVIVILTLKHLYLETSKEDIEVISSPSFEEVNNTFSTPSKLEDKKEELAKGENESLEKETQVVSSKLSTESPSEALKKRFSLQICSFRNRLKAEKIVEELKREGYPGYVVSKDLGEKGVWFRVRIGEFETKEEAEEIEQKVKQEYKDSFIVSY